MDYQIVPIAEEHIASFRAAVDAVARERCFLAMLEAPPLKAVTQFVRENIRTKNPQFVAVVNGKVVGWCDVQRKPFAAVHHSGVLGIGVISDYRNRGIGLALIRATLNAARERGFTRIELTVRADNPTAKALYEKSCFAIEGLCRNHMHVDGVYCDSYLMAVVYD